MRYIVKKGPKVPIRGSGGGQKIETWVIWDTRDARPVSSESTIKYLAEELCKAWNDNEAMNNSKLGKALK